MSRMLSGVEKLFHQVRETTDHAVEELTGPPPLYLPQRDPNPGARQEQLSDSREDYRYDYEKPNATGVPFVKKVPLRDFPSVVWAAEVSRVVHDVLQNAHLVDRVEHDYKEAHLRADARSLAGASPHKVLGMGIDLIAMRLSIGDTGGRPRRFGDYRRSFQSIKAPAVAFEQGLDSAFVQLRLRGANSVWIRGVTALPPEFGITEECASPVLGEGDSLAEALSERRLFLCAYPQMREARRGGYPAPPRITLDYDRDPAAWRAAYEERNRHAYEACPDRSEVPAPYALFVRKRDAETLVPVAIQVFPNEEGRAEQPVYTPADGDQWLAAKALVQSADATMHQASSHLGCTHLVQEAFGLALHNCLAERHPLHRLLLPHFEGTFAINDMAEEMLIATEGVIDNLLCPTIDTFVGLSAQALHDFDFNASVFPVQLVARGVDDPDVLPDYPYRDDGLLIWGALEQFVAAYVEHYYPDDRSVEEDLELQDFVRQASVYKVSIGGTLVGGNIQGLGEVDGRIQTRAYLTTMVTQIIWNGSAQHAAVNFPQADPVLYAPAVPYSMFSLPEAVHDASTLLDAFPPLDLAQLQLGIDHLLGSVHYTRLGHYRRRWFDDPVILSHLSVFQARLDEIERIIDRREESRISWPYFKPSLIPQSINI